MIYLIDEKICEQMAIPLSSKELTAENAKHLKALRPDEGERIAFLNLKGQARIYRVKQANPLLLEYVESRHSEAPSVQTHLYLAPPVGAALEQAIEQATEIGYDFIHFVRAERVQYPKGKEIPVSRLKRIVQASCKQSGRLWAPVIDEKFYYFGDSLLAAARDFVICADESAARPYWGSVNTIVRRNEDAEINFQGKIDFNREQYKSLAIFIGPEGGWADSERSMLKHVARVFSLGPHVLRVSTAVVSAYVLAWKEMSQNG